ncbi:MAG: galactokinase [Flavobacteriaceae bacterium]
MADRVLDKVIVDSPGRINIIGEHTDYNLGYVLPTAIDKKIRFTLERNNTDTQCEIRSKGYEKPLLVDLKHIAPSNTQWENYILGVLYEIYNRSKELKGFRCTIESDLPVGAGVSSSAALECGLAFGLNQLFDLGLSKQEIVNLSRDAEHNYVGTKCGIMDQFASVMSKKNHVILLDCKSMEHTYVPFEISPYKLILLNTNVSHSLASSEYNTRRKECNEGVSVLQKKYPYVTSLRDANIDMIEASKTDMNPKVLDRCAYVVEENSRVLDAVKALKNRDLKKLGTLMYQTHEGLQKLYEVSCTELNFLVDFSKNVEEVLGARVMGGGFGGCTINLVHEDIVDSFIQSISGAYEKEFNIKLTSFVGHPSAGTTLL